MKILVDQQKDKGIFLGRVKKRKLTVAKTRKLAEVKTLTEEVVLPVAKGARLGARHFLVALSFVLIFVLPMSVTFWYLKTHAADQYVSSVGFSVRKEEAPSPGDLLGSISQISSGSSSDTDILYEFIQSQELVERINKKLDLQFLYSKPENDPFFAYKPNGSLESLVDYWNRMVKIFYSGSNGLIKLRVHAFNPEDARSIARAIFEESSLMVNQLSNIAREDVIGYAKDELDLAMQRLKEARKAIVSFRNDTQIVDPNADLQGQMGLINTLQQQLAEAIIEYDLLAKTTQIGDPRIVQAELKVSVIRARIAQERKKLSSADDSDENTYTILIARYEGLIVDREFAEKFYLSALQSYDSARADAQRKSRYLAAYVKPTLAESAQYPQHGTILSIIAFFALLIWSIVVMVGYSIKDRR